MNIFETDNGIRVTISHQEGQYAAHFSRVAPEQEFVNYTLKRDSRGHYHFSIQKTNSALFNQLPFQQELVFGDLGDTLQPTPGVELILL